MPRPRPGGGWPAIAYVFRSARRAGGLLRLFRALRSRNACKTCALGMGGQRGGMVNELGRFPEVCKKSIQAMTADMQGAIRPEFFERVSLHELSALTPRELEHLGRLANPVYAGPGDTHLRAIGWPEAMDRCAGWLRATPPDENFFYFSGRSSNEAAFLWQLFARLYGTNHVNNCSYYCHQASGVGLREALGTGTATVILSDIEHCDLFLLIGGNPASNHPRLMTLLADVRRRGGEVIAINPVREPGLIEFRIPSRPWSLLFGSRIASQYLQPHAGGDVALLTGIAKHVLERGAIATDFIRSHTDGFDAFRTHVESTSWPLIERESGVSRAQIAEAGDAYARAKAAIFGWTMGITHHVHGTDNVRAIVNLALLRGMVGRQHAGLLPIRGHSNVQGVGSVGVVPKLNRFTLSRLQERLGVTLPTTPGLDTLSGLEAMRDGRVCRAWCLGGNLYGASPDARATQAALSRLHSIVYLSTTLNTGHVWGRGRETLILPVRARDEESQLTTQESMFNFVRISDGGPPRLPGCRSEVDIVVDLALRVLESRNQVDWVALRDHDRIRELIADVVPGYEAVGRVGRTRREFYVSQRTFHAPSFPTPSGRAQFLATPLPRHVETVGESAASGALRLITLRSEGQFNTVVYEDEDLYRGLERRDVILMNTADMARLGIREDERVTVRSVSGEMTGIRARPFDIRAGNAAMYYPESNVLVPADADARSRTPAFKNVRIEVLRSAAAGVALPIASAAM